jgi:hypothetical protein
MKTQATVNITGLKTSKNFEKKIAQMVDHAITKIYIDDLYITNAGRHGSYHIVISYKMNGENYIERKHTNSSQLYDQWTSLKHDGGTKYSNFLKDMVVEMVEYIVEHVIGWQGIN